MTRNICAEKSSIFAEVFLLYGLTARESLILADAAEKEAISYQFGEKKMSTAAEKEMNGT